MKHRVLRLAALLPLLCALPARALELADSKWGFDGSSLPGRINIVSFRLFNADSTAFDGTVRLERSSFSGPVGAIHEARVYISPQTYRWVQFQVEPSQANDNFVFRYPLTADREESKSFNDLKEGLPARVILLSATDTSAIPVRLPSFPAEAFPASVSALEALEQLVLDHKPDWDAPRRQALLDWVNLGGVLHLLQDREGRLPVLEGELSALNGTEPRQRVGAGWVVRHDFSRRDATPVKLDESGFPGTGWGREAGQFIHNAFGNNSTGTFGLLKSLIRPQHPWGVINLLLLLYIGLVGPGQYYLVKKRNLDYRLSLLVLVGLVGAFSVIFYQIGLRGYKNPSMVVSVSRATVLPGDRVALTKWAQAFTRSGRVAEFKHPGAAGMYDLPGLDEKVPVRAQNGAQAVMEARMPVNSTLPLVFRGVLPVPVSGLAWVDSGRDTLGRPNLTFTGKPPADLLSGVMFIGKEAWTVDVQADGKLATTRAGSKDSHVQSMAQVQNRHGRSDVPADLSGFLETSTFRNNHLPAWLSQVVTATVNAEPDQNYYNWMQDPDWKASLTDVFIPALSTPATALTGDGFREQPGITIYHWRLPPPPATVAATPARN
jgi:hypothetical protein